MKSFPSRFFSDESGATAIEYGLICRLGIAVTIITIVATVGTDLSAKFTAVDNGKKPSRVVANMAMVLGAPVKR